VYIWQSYMQERNYLVHFLHLSAVCCQAHCVYASVVLALIPTADTSRSSVKIAEWIELVVSNKCIAVRKVATPLRELTCHMGLHSVTCHPAEVTFLPLPQPQLVLN